MLEQTIKFLPKSAGIYQFFDEKGKLLYIGKAKKLNLRVKSYFRFVPKFAPSPNLGLRIKSMILQAKSLKYITVKSEQDAFILENSLIKQLKPKYNILLRDDKTYPYIALNLEDDFPRFEITRKIVKGRDIKYFGPFSSGARDFLNALYLVFPLVQKKSCLKGGKSCLFYQIKRCLAPCESLVSKEEYAKIVQQAFKAFSNSKILIEKLEYKMQDYSNQLNFEEAAKMRDMIVSVEKIEPKNVIDLASLESFDLFGVFVSSKTICAIKLFIRDGKIVTSSHDITCVDFEYDVEEIYRQMLLSFYTKDIPMPINTIYTAHGLKEAKELEEILSSMYDKKIHIKNPKRGKKLDLIKLAYNNAKELISLHGKEKSTIIQSALQSYFSLNSFPYSIEAFDNSHISGTANVGAIVSWEGNDFNKSKYRHYHLENTDEYGQMRELLVQRAKRFEKEPPPDLWVIDGGKTLFNLALDIISSFGVNIDIIAISKEKNDAKTKRAKGKAKDILHTEEKSYKLSENDERLQFIQRLRDEAHRFAISFHRKTKAKLDKESSVLKKKGLSDGKIQKLLSYFGTFDAIYQASKEEISNVIGKKMAEKF